MSRYSRYSAEGRNYPGDDGSASPIVPVGQGSGAQNARQYSRGSANYTHKEAKRKAGRGKKIAMGVLCAVLVVLVGCGAAFAVWFANISSNLNTGDLTQEQLQAIDAELTSANLNEPFYMVLIGSDARPGQAQIESRSDTNILVRVDPQNKIVSMVSILRDTAIDIDGHGISKFNNAYSYDGVAGVIREASELCGVDISYYAEVNFDSLVALVDAVGGVDIEVEERIADPKADRNVPDTSSDYIVIEEGLQHLSGEEALVFARSRAYADGDYTRTSHQRALVNAVVDKVLSLPATDLPGVIEAASQCVTTNLTVFDIISLAQNFQGDGEMTVYSATIPSTAQYVNGISYVFADTDGLAEMMKLVEAGKDPNGESATSASASSAE